MAKLVTNSHEKAKKLRFLKRSQMPFISIWRTVLPFISLSLILSKEEGSYRDLIIAM